MNTPLGITFESRGKKIVYIEAVLDRTLAAVPINLLIPLALHLCKIIDD